MTATVMGMCSYSHDALIRGILTAVLAIILILFLGNPYLIFRWLFKTKAAYEGDAKSKKQVHSRIIAKIVLWCWYIFWAIGFISFYLIKDRL